MKITFLGHASLLIETKDQRIVVDPFITPNELAKKIDLQSLKPNFIVLTHAHGDHVYDAEQLAKENDATIISNAEIASYYGAKGLRSHGLNTGGSYDFPFGKLHATIAFHSSSFDDGSNGGSPNGYVIESDGKRLYIAGDTALTYEMKLIPETLGKVDLAILPIGGNFTMGYQQATKAAEFVEVDKVLGYHYDTFPPIKINHEEAKKAFAEQNKELVLLEIGDSITI